MEESDPFIRMSQLFMAWSMAFKVLQSVMDGNVTFNHGRKYHSQSCTEVPQPIRTLVTMNGRIAINDGCKYHSQTQS